MALPANTTNDAAANERLLAVLDVTTDFIATAMPDGTLVDLNPAGCAMLGLNQGETIRDLHLETICPDELNPVSAPAILAAAALSGNWRGDGVFVGHDGQRLPVSLMVVAHRGVLGTVDFLSVTARDITSIRKREQRLHLLERALEAVGSGIVITDVGRNDNPIIYCNSAFERITGYSREELLGKNCRVLQGSGTDLKTIEELRNARRHERACRVVLLNYRKDGTAFWNDLSLSPVRGPNGQLTHFIGIQNDVTAAKEAEDRVRRSEELFRVITENATDLIAVVDRHGKRLYNSPSYGAVLGFTPEELASTNAFAQMHPEDRPQVMATAEESLATGHGRVVEYRMRHKDGSWRTFESHGAVIRNVEGEIDGLLVVGRDITQRKEAEKERGLMEMQLHQAQKLESIGQLASGIAHEINTPTQFIGDNTRFLDDAFRDLDTLLAQFRELHAAVRASGGHDELVARIDATVRQVDLDYLQTEIPVSIRQSLEGVDRVTKIVRAMKEFSHPGTLEKVPLDINHAIESTLTVARNVWKYVADLSLDLDASLPPVPCLPGEFNQVILNLVVNAAHAITDAVGDNTGRKGVITVGTRLDDGWAEIRIGDSGTGIPEHVRERIFDPFFTTKPMGKGTGQGLAIARSAIVDKHGGTISFETKSGEGTTFIIRLPVKSIRP